jgi:tetratricopeptide (TPR) repeat protein
MECQGRNGSGPRGARVASRQTEDRKRTMLDERQESVRFSPKVLQQVAEHIAGQRSVFTLLVSDAPNEKVLYFANGGIRLLCSGDRRVEDIESRLLKTQKLSIDELHGALELSRKKSKSLKECLIEKKLISNDEYRKIVEDLIRDELLDLVFWEHAFFQCYTGAPPQEIYDRETKALVGSPSGPALASDLSDWIKRWERLRPSLHSDRALVRTTNKARFGLERMSVDDASQSRDLLEACLQAGEIDLRSLWLKRSIALPVLCDAIDDFARKGWVEIERPVRPEPGAEQLEAEARQLEDNVERVIAKELIREKLIQIYGKLGRKEKAAAELRSLAEAALQRSQWPIAVERFKQILDLDPEKLEVLEEILGIQLKQRLDREAFRVVDEHARKLSDAGKFDAARAAVTILRRMAGPSVESDALLAAASARSGDVETAVKQYLDVAAEYDRQGKRRDAVRLLEQALSTCHDAEPVRRKLRELGGGSSPTTPTGSPSRKTALSARPKSISGIPRIALAAGILVTIGVGIAIVLRSSKPTWAGAEGDTAIAPSLEYGADIGTETDDGWEIDDSNDGTAPIDDGVRLDAAGAREFIAAARARVEAANSAGAGAGGGVSTFDPRALAGNDRGGGTAESESSASNGTSPQLALGRDGTSAAGSRPSSAIPDLDDRSRIARLTDRAIAVLGMRTAASSTGVESGPWSAAGAGPRGLGLTPGQFQRLSHHWPADWSADSPNLGAPVLESAAMHGQRAGLGQNAKLEILDNELLVVYQHAGPLVGIHPATGARRFAVTGKPATRWAFSHRGLRICRWGPNQHMLLFNTKNGMQSTTSWKTAADALAVAAGLEWIAIRTSSDTKLCRMSDGQIVRAAALPDWETGCFLEDLLLLTRRPEAVNPAGQIWVIHAPSWTPMWTWAGDMESWTIR